MELRVSLFEKQAQAFERLTDRKTRTVVFGGGMASGKASACSAMVYTPFGPKPMGKIKVGDVVSNPAGCNTTVIAVYPQGFQDVYEVTFFDGAKTKVTKDHLWQVWYASKKSKQQYKTGVQGLKVTTATLMKSLHKRPIIPLSMPVQFTLPRGRSAPQAIPSYVLGILIGDGSLTKEIAFTTHDYFIVNEVKHELGANYELRKAVHDQTYRIFENNKMMKDSSVTQEIYKYGLNCKSESKFIPKHYYTATIEERLALMQGLMDADGYVAVKKNSVYYTTVSKQLSLDVQYILRSLGFSVTISSKIGSYIDKNGVRIKCLEAYTLYIKGRDPSILFRLPRKKDRCIQYKKGEHSPGRRIVSIKYVGREECQCITVDNPNSLYITDDFIVTHNTWLGCSWLLAMCLGYPGTKWYVGRLEIKKTISTVLESFGKVSEVWGVFNQWDYKERKNEIHFLNGSIIVFVDLVFQPKDPLFERFGGLEFTGGWIEEAGEISVEAFYRITRRESRWKNVELDLPPVTLCTCNPKKNWLYHQFYKPFMNGTLDKDKAFIQSLAKDNLKLHPSYIADLEAEPDGIQKQRLLYGNWNYEDDPEQLILQEWVEQCFETPVNYGTKYFGVDVARFGNDSSVIAMLCGNSFYNIMSFEGLDTASFGELVKDQAICEGVADRNIGVDVIGLGAGVVDTLSKHNWKVHSIHSGHAPVYTKDTYRYAFSNLRSQMWWIFREALRNGQINIDLDLNTPLAERIIKELTAPSYEVRGDKVIKVETKSDIKERLGHSPDNADAMVYAYFMSVKRALKSEAVNYVTYNGPKSINRLMFG